MVHVVERRWLQENIRVEWNSSIVITQCKLSSQSDFLQKIQMIISGLDSRNFSFSDVCLVDVGRCSNQWSNPSEDLFALYLWIPRIPRVTFMICDVGWTHIEDEEEPAPVDEDDGAGDHGHQPGGRHADDPGEEGWEGAVAQPGTETPRLRRETAIRRPFSSVSPGWQPALKRHGWKVCRGRWRCSSWGGRWKPGSCWKSLHKKSGSSPRTVFTCQKVLCSIQEFCCDGIPEEDEEESGWGEGKGGEEDWGHRPKLHPILKS